MRLFLILSLLISSVALAAPLKGPSYIGICNSKFPCKEALSIFEGQDAKVIGYLSDAFGHECSCVREFLKLPGGKYVRVHLANGTCFPERGRRCGKFDVFYGETQKSAQKKLERKNPTLLRRYRASIMRTKAILGDPREDLTIRYSLCLECKLSDKARSMLLKEALRHLAKDTIVDSPMNFKCLAGLVCEKHGDSMRYSKGQRCISDTDGVSAFEGDLERLEERSKQCEAIFYWSYGFNLLPYGYSGRFISPYKRTKAAEDWEFQGVKGCIEQ